MSIETWKEEFYPITAEEANAGGSATVGELIEHSLRKWRGATEENLTRHGLNRQLNVILADKDDNCFNFDIESCALCQRFNVDSDLGICVGCPLVDDKGRPCYEYGRGYFRFADLGHGPDLMIQELEGALEKWRKENV